MSRNLQNNARKAIEAQVIETMHKQGNNKLVNNHIIIVRNNKKVSVKTTA